VRNMLINQIVSQYPKLYHMSDKRNWVSIRQHGLLSTSALLDLFEYDGAQRAQIESRLRLKEIRITHENNGEAFIRDQDPMRDRPQDGTFLVKCLVGISPQTWFEFLNNKVFFWTGSKGLGFMLNATLYWRKSHYIFTVDTRSLLTRHADRVLLSAMNSGSLYKKEFRSLDTFKPIDQYQARWIRELTVGYSVPDIFDLTVSVDECMSQGKNVPYKTIRRIWPS